MTTKRGGLKPGFLTGAEKKRAQHADAESLLARGFLMADESDGHFAEYSTKLPVEKHLAAILKRLVDTAAVAIVLMKERGTLTTALDARDLERVMQLGHIVDSAGDNDHAIYERAKAALCAIGDARQARLAHLNAAIGIYMRDPECWKDDAAVKRFRPRVEKLVAEANAVLAPVPAPPRAKRARRRGRR